MGEEDATDRAKLQRTVKVNVLLGFRVTVGQMRMNIDQARNNKVSREVVFLRVGQLRNILCRSDAGNDPVLGDDRVVLDDLLFDALKELAASHMDLFDHRTPLSVSST